MTWTYSALHFLKVLSFTIAEDFEKFLDDNFDAKTHATAVIQSMAVTQQLSKLQEGIGMLDKELHSQVLLTLKRSRFFADIM